MLQHEMQHYQVGTRMLALSNRKVSLHNRSPVLHVPVPPDPFSHVHIDLVGPFPLPMAVLILTSIDRSTHWLEEIPLLCTTADICVRTFMNEWIAILVSQDTSPQTRVHSLLFRCGPWSLYSLVTCSSWTKILSWVPLENCPSPKLNLGCYLPI